jgi:hypothetical protein
LKSSGRSSGSTCDEPSADDLAFVRTAVVEDTCCWIWRFHEPDGGDPAYATVAVGEFTILEYETDYHGLSPEQFILGSYHGVFRSTCLPAALAPATVLKPAFGAVGDAITGCCFGHSAGVVRCASFAAEGIRVGAGAVASEPPTCSVASTPDPFDLSRGSLPRRGKSSMTTKSYPAPRRRPGAAASNVTRSLTPCRAAARRAAAMATALASKPAMTSCGLACASAIAKPPSWQPITATCRRRGGIGAYFGLRAT